MLAAAACRCMAVDVYGIKSVCMVWHVTWGVCVCLCVSGGEGVVGTGLPSDGAAFGPQTTDPYTLSSQAVGQLGVGGGSGTGRGWDEVGKMQAPQLAGLGAGPMDTCGIAAMSEFAQGTWSGGWPLWPPVQWSFREGWLCPGLGSPNWPLRHQLPLHSWQQYLSARPGPPARSPPPEGAHSPHGHRVTTSATAVPTVSALAVRCLPGPQPRPPASQHHQCRPWPESLWGQPGPSPGGAPRPVE